MGQSGESVVVFVCEHGSAKSVVAAAHFNRLARERCLNATAVARGIHPDEQIAPAAAAGLAADGLTVEEKPTRLSKDKVTRAIRIVAFCDLPKDLSAGAYQIWQVPPVSADYSTARDVILSHLARLLDELQGGR